MPRSPERERVRRDLIEARGKIRRQLEILRRQPSTGDPCWGGDRAVIARLKDELCEINVALALGVPPNA